MSETISMPKEALDALLENAAERGAKKALASVGLDDEKAPEHIRGLRDLFMMYRAVRHGALTQIGQAIAFIVIGGCLLFLGQKLKIGG